MDEGKISFLSCWNSWKTSFFVFRSYQCIKILVNAANKSPAVKDRLLLDSARWQWAVNWLKNKMGSGDNGTQSTNYWNSASSLSPTSTSDVVSNEDPSTRYKYQIRNKLAFPIVPSCFTPKTLVRKKMRNIAF